MPFSKEYIPFIDKEIGVGKSLMRPRNIYKINSYTYKDGTTKSLAGVETSYVFVTGISPTKLVSALKISLVKPKDFFRWLKKLYRPGVSETYINNSERLEDILILDNKDGQKIFNQFVKQSRLYTQSDPTFRTYLLNSIKNVELVSIKKDILIKYIK